MSAYAVVADLDTFGVKPAAYPADITAGVKATHLGIASAMADSYLGKRFALPLTAWGDDLRGAVCRIATYTLLSRRGFDATNTADQLVVKGNDDAIAWLRDVAKGLAEPVGVVDSTPENVEAAPLFDGDEAAGWTFGNAHYRDW